MQLSEVVLYNQWANHQYFDAISKLSGEQFDRNVGGSFPSLHETLLHLAWAEWIWAARWEGSSPQFRAMPKKYPTVESIRAYMKGAEEIQLRMCAGGESANVSLRIRYTNLKNEVWEYSLEQMVHHVLMHSAYHRGQLADQLRRLGVAPPTTDYLNYVDSLHEPGA